MEQIPGDELTKLGNLQPSDINLTLAGDHCAKLSDRKTVNDQSTKHLYAKSVRQQESFGAPRWAAGK
jgi:hypothetical protein